MAGPQLRDTILEVFQADPRRDLSAREILDAVVAQDPTASEPSVRAKISELQREGILSKLERSQYCLLQIEHPTETPLEAIAAHQLRQILTPKAMMRAVIWEATPYLAQAEDGAPGVRLVIEHPAVDQLKGRIESAWHEWTGPFDWGTRDHEGAPQLLAWDTSHKGPLGELLWEPDTASPTKIHLGIILVRAERLGGTGWTPQGYRAPTHERILTEFLTDTVDATAATDILRAGLMHPTFDVRRAQRAAHALGVSHHLHALLAAAHHQLPPRVKAQHLAAAPGFLKGFLEADS